MEHESPDASRLKFSDVWGTLEADQPWLLQTEAEAQATDFSQYRDDPIGYFRDVLELTLTPDQEEIVLSVRDNRYTAAKASHAVGKTFCAAGLACWFYDCWPQHIVYINAPTWAQTLKLTFKQVKRFRLEKRLPGEVLDSGLIRDGERLRQTDHFIQAINAQSAEGFQGEHSAPILLIFDEAVGILPHIWEAAKGLLTSQENRLLAVFNPTDEATEAGQMCRRRGVKVITISALAHPNIQAELQCQPQPYPGAVSLLWLVEMLEEECDPADKADGDTFSFYETERLRRVLAGEPIEEGEPKRLYRPNATFQGKVLGIFPTQADEQVIPRGWLENLPVLEWQENVLPEIGCDVARHGSDRTTILIRHGWHPLSLKEIRQMDNLQVAEALREAAREAVLACSLTNDNEHPEPEKRLKIKIDVTGGLGTGPYDILKSEGYQVVPANASAKAADTEQYRNRRSETYFVSRKRVRDQQMDLSRLPRAMREKLILELSTPKYRVNASGQKEVEPKDKIKERLGQSPDLADAFNLAYTDFGRWWEDADLTAWLKTRGQPEPAAPVEEKKATCNLMQSRL